MELEFDVSGLDEEIEQLTERLGLSPTRGRVLALVKTHHSKEDIADKLDITEQTVQNHIQDLRAEITAAEELLDVAGCTHYDDSDLFREFGGSLWLFRAGMRYEKNADTDIEKKLYASPYGKYMLTEREVTEHHGRITESRTRTEFHSGEDIVAHLVRGRKFDAFDVARLHTEFLARSGIDPKHDPKRLAREVEPTADCEIISDGDWLEIEA